MLFVICILCAALALWLAATLFLWHRELLEIQKALEDIGAGNLNRRIVTRGPQAIRSIGYGINKIVQQSQQSAIQQKRHEQAYKQLITNLSHDIKTPLASLTGYLEAVENGLVVGQEKEEYLQTAYERAGALRSFVEKLFEWVKLDSPSVFRKQKRCHKATLFLPSGISLTGVFPSTPQTAVVPLPTGKTPGSWAAGTGRSAPAPAGVRRPPGS